MKQVLIQAALNCGASGAAVVEREQIVLNAMFRDICAANGCGNYGRCHMCPPDVGEIGPLMEQVRGYACGLLYQTVSPLEDSYDFEGMMEAGHNHALLSQRLQQAVGPMLSKPFLHLSSGGCHLCEVCAKRENEPCRQPEKALSSLEAYGIDVYNTAKATDLPYGHGANTVTYFGIVLFTE